MLHEFTLMVLAPQKAVVYNNIFLSPDIYVLLVTEHSPAAGADHQTLSPDWVRASEWRLGSERDSASPGGLCGQWCRQQDGGSADGWKQFRC